MSLRTVIHEEVVAAIKDADELPSEARIRVAKALDKMAVAQKSLAAFVPQYALHNDREERRLAVPMRLRDWRTVR